MADTNAAWYEMLELPDQNDEGTEGGTEDIDWEYVGVPDGATGWCGKKRRKLN